MPLKQSFLGSFCLLRQGTINAYISVIYLYLQALALQAPWWLGGGGQARTIWDSSSENDNFSEREEADRQEEPDASIPRTAKDMSDRGLRRGESPWDVTRKQAAPPH